MNKNSRCLITGASGFIGRLLCGAFSRKGWEVVAVRHNTALPESLRKKIVQEEIVDLGDAESTFKLVERSKADLVIHAAALSSPARCEQEPDLCFKSNILGTQNILRACELTSPRDFYFLSSDMVFDGASAPLEGFSESHRVQPISVYSRAKFEAECVVLGSTLRRSVLRLSLSYGPGEGNTLSWMVETLRSGEKLKLFRDEIRTPFFAGDLPRIISELSSVEALPAIIHVGGPERISRFEFGSLAARTLGLSEEKIVSCLREESPSPFRRPEDLSLQTDLLRSFLSEPLSNVQTGILRSFEEDSWW